jgi:hypothetical protein
MHDWVTFKSYCTDDLRISVAHGYRLVREKKLPKPVATHPDGRTKFYTPEQVAAIEAAQRAGGSDAR